MKNDCSKWKDLMLEAALAETAAGELQDHLSECAGCVQQLALLRARRERLDAILPLLAGQQGPSPEFGARVLAAAEGKNPRKKPEMQRWLRAAAAIMVSAFVTVVVLRPPTVLRPSDTDLVVAQKLAQWHAPSDALLATPGQEILSKMPNLGESYLKFQAKTK